MSSSTLLERQLEASVREAQARKRSDIDEWLDAAPVPPKRLIGKCTMSETTEAVEVQPKALAKAAAPGALAKVPEAAGIGVDELVARVTKVREVQARVMKKGHHYGQVPGIEKPTLLKPGAELLGLTFQLDPQFSATDRWDGEHLECVVTCTLYHAPTETRLGSGIGSCSTREKKYAWRGGGRKCPSCGSATALMKSKDKPEFFCWRKKDGCGATFPEKDERITSQKVGRVPNPDIADQYNTVRKMACKRAHVAAILFVTCASEIFTQDVEDQDGHAGFDNMSHIPDMEGEAPPDEEEREATYGKLHRRLTEAVEAIERCDSYDAALRLRAIIGTKGKQSPLMAEVQKAGPTDRVISGEQFRELGRIWHRADRQLSKKEKQLAPGPEQSFSDADDTGKDGPYEVA